MNRRYRPIFGPDAVTIAQALWVRHHPGGEAGFRAAMAEADHTAARALEIASRIVQGRANAETSR